ncbi:Translation initiation factor IF-2 [Segatella copri]|nr:Translation initiation factor IF-2 [Segatella copri]
MNLLVEEWGGKYQCQEISAKKGIGVHDLLDKVLLEADMLDLKANPNRRATGRRHRTRRYFLGACQGDVQ